MTVVKHIFTEYVDYIRHSGQEKSEYDTLLKTYTETGDLFITTLSPAQKSAALELEAQRTLIAAMDEELKFCQGLRIGARLILELLSPQP